MKNKKNYEFFSISFLKLETKMKNKKAIEMTFNWLFAIIVGGFILFIAIYGASKLIRTSEQSVYTETAASLVSLFDPLETGLASGKASEISFNKKSRIFLECSELANPPFGKQTLSFSEQTFGKEFGGTGGGISIKDKYVFAEEMLEGKKIYYFTKPFFMGFKVSDLLMMYGDTTQYCVYSAPEDFKDDIEALHLPLVIFPNSSEKCEGTKVCFDAKGNCDIKVVENEGYVSKHGKKLYYKNDLLYAAIFSSPDMYECNIKRIKQRYNELAKIYLEKIKIIERLDCEPQIGLKLADALNTDIRHSKDLHLLFTLLEDIDNINKRAKEGCKIYYNVNFER